MSLITHPHLDAPDDFYEDLIEAHQGLSADESHAFNARLLLLLANHVGSRQVLREALAAAAVPREEPSLLPDFSNPP
ncbi:conserved hypothetical protein [Burkholderiales bacterium 8X]|nr:conserved hypothetical protein [Burkholderiales bacterium 8X]